MRNCNEATQEKEKNKILNCSTATSMRTLRIFF